MPVRSAGVLGGVTIDVQSPGTMAGKLEMLGVMETHTIKLIPVGWVWVLIVIAGSSNKGQVSGVVQEVGGVVRGKPHCHRPPSEGMPATRASALGLLSREPKGSLSPSRDSWSRRNFLHLGTWNVFSRHEPSVPSMQHGAVLTDQADSHQYKDRPLAAGVLGIHSTIRSGPWGALLNHLAKLARHQLLDPGEINRKASYE